MEEKYSNSKIKWEGVALEWGLGGGGVLLINNTLLRYHTCSITLPSCFLVFTDYTFL